jgi:malonate-semialdehyde dehydrogenase (acetylating)/methylmalonate-semialdehyde dehydrogenase
MKLIGHFINGREVSSSSTRTADVFNPATGEIQRKVSLGLASE